MHTAGDSCPAWTLRGWATKPNMKNKLFKLTASSQKCNPKRKKVDKRKPKTPRKNEMTEERVDEPSDDDEDISDLNNSHNSGRKRQIMKVKMRQ